MIQGGLSGFGFIPNFLAWDNWRGYKVRHMTQDSTGASSPMPRYRCHKEVSALKIKNHQWVLGGRVLEITPADEGFAPFRVDEDWIRRFSGLTLAGGYYVVYADGYKSFSPARAFEDGYTKI